MSSDTTPPESDPDLTARQNRFKDWIATGGLTCGVDPTSALAAAEQDMPTDDYASEHYGAESTYDDSLIEDEEVSFIGRGSVASSVMMADQEETNYVPHDQDIHPGALAFKSDSPPTSANISTPSAQPVAQSLVVTQVAVAARSAARPRVPRMYAARHSTLHMFLC